MNDAIDPTSMIIDENEPIKKPKVKPKLKECVVCEKEKSAYKCPSCRSFYCSSKCCSIHKSICIEAKRSLEDGSEEKSSEKRVKLSLTTNEQSTANMNDDDFSTQFALLTSERLSLLEKSKVIREKLKSTKLQKHILEIDTEKGENRSRALRKLRANNPEFASFVDLMLQELSGSR